MITDTIERIIGREIFDSRGRPTVEVDIRLNSGIQARASVPSGASTGTHEAHELRDGDPARHRGLGVLNAVRNVNEIIAPALRHMAIIDQTEIDQRLIELDGSPDKSLLGANAILAVSLCAARCAATAMGQPLWRYLLPRDEQPLLPMPMINMISGGLHASRNLDLQDFLIVPIGAATYREAIDMAFAVRWALRDRLLANGESALLADEGGFSPRLDNNRGALEMLVRAIEDARLEPGEQVAIALDVASTHFYRPEHGDYSLANERRTLDAEGMIELFEQWSRDFPIVSIEDPLAEDDWEGWARLTARLGDRMQILGDDLFTTNPDRLRRGIEMRAANAILVKMNQIGTISETMAVAATAQQAGFRTVISARSGETEDAALADLSVATRGGQLKVGSLACMERLCKYNRVLEIEAGLGDTAQFADRTLLRMNANPNS